MMRTRKSFGKSGQTRYIYEHAMRVIIIIFAFTAVVILVQLYVITKLYIQPAAAEVLFARVYYSPTTIWAMDPLTGRSEMGVIDVQTFNQARLEAAINYGTKDHISARVMLVDDKKAQAGDYSFSNCDERQGEAVKTLYINKELWKTLCVSSVSIAGSGSATILSRQYPVSIINENKITPGMLSIQVLTPNS
jgi:hypothetical protein